MKYLQLKHVNSDKRRKNGTRVIIPLLVEKNRKFGSVVDTTTINRKQPVLVSGAHASGKTRFLSRLHEHALDIWGGHGQIKTRLWIDGLRSMSEWFDNEDFERWYVEKREKWKADLQEAKKNQVKRAGSDKSKKSKLPQSMPTWKQLQNYQKAKHLPSFCREAKAILFINNADKLTGRKEELVRDCVVKSRIYVVGTLDEGRIAPNLRTLILNRREPQRFNLDSETSYDATNLFTFMMLLGAVSAGAYELAVVLGGVRLLGRGRRSVRDV